MKQSFVHYGFNASRGIAKELIHSARDSPPGSPLHLASLVFAAFTYESALNQLGRLTFDAWDQHLDRLSIEGKLALLTEKARVEVDASRRPFQSLSLLLNVRNALAHPKISELDVTPEQLADPSKWPKPKWRTQAENLSASDALDDVEVVVSTLEQRLGVQLPPRFLLAEVVHNQAARL